MWGVYIFRSSNMLPAAEGTICGDNRWCRQGQCVSFESNGVDAVDGEWGAWGSLTSCLTTCGTGIRLRERECNAPAPMFGGKNCVGEKYSTTVCKGPPCTQSDSPREKQCNSISNYGAKWEYYPEVTTYRSCSIKCLATIGHSFELPKIVYKFSKKFLKIFSKVSKKFRKIFKKIFKLFSTQLIVTITKCGKQWRTTVRLVVRLEVRIVYKVPVGTWVVMES